ncbi:3D (Asp-Asp-Asp) domain-containing protein [Maridesulfovibrio ferrireducens]|uniref:3D (Asp-Asp-Asp) domain-containing protein n=1 Tax=Maridesulfovibrio ferrireducens TaxID=246191 RepID=A0A1G9KI67_9BACT|nr:3D domain-containing protein [Maridesulfovibrio ferrireducens]SDL49217.1 3D (Asp-Asp-Asp) domain-containing protein [Maridesulfovibrio ferrireducens]
MSKFKLLLLVVVALLFVSGCSDDNKMTMKVAASAYTSHVAQTSSTPFIGAWGDELKPGMKAIAVSRDLIKKGLVRGTAVKIEGLEGKYLVKDKMNKRWTDKIDIYMGLDTKAAKDWGKREVTIEWENIKS